MGVEAALFNISAVGVVGSWRVDCISGLSPLNHDGYFVVTSKKLLHLICGRGCSV